MPLLNQSYMQKTEFSFSDDTMQRADSWLAERLAGSGFSVTRSYLKKLFEEGLVFVSGKQAKPGQKLKSGELVCVNLPAPKEADVLPEAIALDVVFEDKDVVVVNKPQGMVVHPAPGHYSGTLVNALLHHCTNLSGINGVLRPGIVHRLDKDTSGLIICAKNDAAHKHLASQFQERTAKRVYHAICVGRLEEDLTVNAPIGRHPVNRLKMAVVHGGREAVTHIKTLDTFNKFTHVEAALKTGRTHQIRVHLAHIHRPVLGDALYGAPKQPLGQTKQALHAKCLSFVHPSSEEQITFETDLPSYFTELLARVASVS